MRSCAAHWQERGFPTRRGYVVNKSDWIFPDRPLGPEMDTVLEVGYLKGADLWHVATALAAARDPREMSFITLDERQRAVAAELGFCV